MTVSNLAGINETFDGDVEWETVETETEIPREGADGEYSATEEENDCWGNGTDTMRGSVSGDAIEGETDAEDKERAEGDECLRGDTRLGGDETGRENLRDVEKRRGLGGSGDLDTALGSCG